jgi:hypothetical protein
MTQLVHLGTTIQTTFGLVDDDGNVIPQPPIPAQLVAFSAAEFTAAFEGIREQRDAALHAFKTQEKPPATRAIRQATPKKIDPAKPTD